LMNTVKKVHEIFWKTKEESLKARGIDWGKAKSNKFERIWNSVDKGWLKTVFWKIIIVESAAYRVRKSMLYFNQRILWIKHMYW
jgi:hypothetical protein